MKKLITKILGDDFKLINTVEFNGDLFVFYKHRDSPDNPFKDERLNIVSGQGPIRINLKSKNFEFMNIYDFSSQYADNEVFFPKKEEDKIDINEIIFNIKNRKHINSDEFHQLLDYYKLPEDSFYMHGYNFPKEIEIEISNIKAKNYLIQFLDEVNASYTKINDNHFVVKLDIENQNLNDFDI